MKIKELYVENFGKLSQYKLSLSDGLNSFVEDNGYGKTTLSVFIKAMIYGFDDTRKHSLDENDRKKYTPWQGGAFGGYLVFSVNGIDYRVERTFGQKASDDTYNLYNLNTGRVSNDFSASLGEELFGIDADGFERTVFLSEKNLSGKNTNQSISAKLSNLVGTEGDIGGFDEAIKLLDERRKFYQKRGGAGEIKDVEYEISELEEKIRLLYEKRGMSAESEAEIAKLSEKIALIKDKKKLILEKEHKEKLENEKRGYEIQYNDMLGALKIDEDRETELLQFFREKLPSNAEVALAAESDSEIKRLRRTLSDIGENLELNELKSFFKNKTTASECEKMRASARYISESRATSFASTATPTVQSPFKRIPAINEINSHIAELNAHAAKKRSSNLALSFIGLILAGIGLTAGFLFNATLFILAGIGFLLTFVGILPVFAKKSSGKHLQCNELASAFVREIYGTREFHSTLSALEVMKSELEAYERHFGEANLVKQEKEALSQSIIVAERELREFLEKFPDADGLTLEEKADVIAYKQRRYEILIEFEAEKENERESCKEKIKKHEEKLKSFVSLFPIKTDDPISEIRRNLAEYEVIRISLTRRRGDAERFASSHGIALVPRTTPLSHNNAINDFSGELRAIEEELLTAEREKARLETDYSIYVREIDTIEELEEKLREKKEKIQLFRDNLAIITKTKDMLAKSRDSMTSKYLETTKRGFEHYLTLIDEATAEFTIDTSFTIMKTDLGKSRQAEAYSRGTRDMHALAMRLALIDSLYGTEAPPIILDDPFIAFDDRHVERASAVLKKIAHEKQILYFTCSKSRKVKY